MPDNQPETRPTAQQAHQRAAAQDAARKMGNAKTPQHLSEDQPDLDRTGAANADSFPASDPLPAQSHID